MSQLIALTPFDAAKIPSRSWLVPGLLLDGAVTLVVAAGGAGKSALALRLALSVAAGTAWGPWTPRTHRNVMVLNAEDDADEMRRRIAANFDTELSAEHVAHRVFTVEAPNLALVGRMANQRGEIQIQRTELFESLREMIRANSIGLLVLDPLIELGRDMAESDNADMAELMTSIREVAREAKIPVLVVHHVKKGDASGADRSRGATAIVNAARVVLSLDPLTQSEADTVSRMIDKTPAEALASCCKASVVKSNYAARGGPRVLDFQSAEIGNGDRAARLVHVDIEIGSAGTFEPRRFAEWPELLALVEAGNASGEPWLASTRASKDRRLDCAVAVRWRLADSDARALLDRGEAEGRIVREILIGAKNKPEVWRVGPTPGGADVLPWLECRSE